MFEAEGDKKSYKNANSIVKECNDVEEYRVK